ncbi:MAG: tyrosine-type recombinase/integrase [Spirochaetia bacterium]|nr:tyrosine-type recombinase/integrase [Spirochaetia bacterium]
MKESQFQEFKEFMVSANYADGTIRQYTTALKRLPEEPANCTEQVLYEHIKSALERWQYSCPKYEYNQIRAAAHLLFLQQTGKTMKEYFRSTRIPDQYDPILTEFYDYSVNFKKVSMQTADSERNNVKRFLSATVKCMDRVDWSEITAFDISEFISDQLSHLRNISKGGYTKSIRNFFRFLDDKGIRVHISIFNLPLSPANWPKSTLPVTLTDNEVEKLLKHYNQDSARDTRNYAVVLTFLDLGLRCSEVTNLNLKDIHWDSGEVVIRRTKTNSERVLPLSQRLGEALEKYVMHYRPNSSDEHLFLRTGRCEGMSVDKEYIRRIIRFAFTKENITGRWKGTHALRRTAASKIFNAGNSLKITADILGHKVIDSTTAYVKIDIASLRTITGNWPFGGEKC